MHLNYKTKTLTSQGVRRRWKESQSHPDKKTAMFTLKFGESLTIEHDCENLMEVKIQTDKGSKIFYFKLPQPKEEDR
ncbi:hypothetical protein [Helicobacter pylori]|uniref:hypothetical protein n=1 Tax=Helicobacter pylori TaxID=210 RepID=UPI000C317E33|nr:hypothetical protein [Helicobacter pylori]WRE46774.1 hypothetical protein KVD60_02305 [Helicobacter pylori]